MLRIALIAASFGCAVFAQQIFSNGSFSTAPDGSTQAVFSNFHALPVVTGAPYSADTVTDHNQTLADGAHITESHTTQRIARDPQGRVRIESPIFPGRQQKLPTLIQIYDPVANAAYILDEQNKVAHRIALPPVREAAPPPGLIAGGANHVEVGTTGVTAGAREIHPNQPQRSVEQLATETIEGVVAQGRRTTTTWPIGSRGNDRPLVETSETWYSPELKATVLAKSSNPTTGDNTVKLTNISRAEPDASLFQPPPGYTVVDDNNSVTLNVKPQ